MEKTDDQLDEKAEHYRGMLEQMVPDLALVRSKMTQSIVKIVTDREERDMVIELSNRIFDVNYRTNNPNEYAADQAQFTQILSRYGVNTSGAKV